MRPRGLDVCLLFLVPLGRVAHRCDELELPRSAVAELDLAQKQSLGRYHTCATVAAAVLAEIVFAAARTVLRDDGHSKSGSGNRGRGLNSGVPLLVAEDPVHAAEYALAIVNLRQNQKFGTGENLEKILEEISLQ